MHIYHSLSSSRVVLAAPNGRSSGIRSSIGDVVDGSPGIGYSSIGAVVGGCDGLGVGDVVGGCDGLASEGTVESGPLQGFPVPSAPSAEEMPAAAPLRNWEMPPMPPPRNFCSACGAPVQGPFCGQCGARA